MHFVIRFRKSDLITRFDIEFLYKVLFAKKNSNNQYPEFENILCNTALDTKLKFRGNKEDHDNFEVLIFYQYNGILELLPRFTSEISVYDHIEDSKMYNRLRKDERYHLVGNETIRELDPIEFMILCKVLNEYATMKQKLGVVEYCK